MDPDQAKAVRDWPHPETHKQLQQFLSLHPYQLTSSLQTFVWTPEDEKVFIKLKELFTSTTILTLLDLIHQFIVEVDVSDLDTVGDEGDEQGQCVLDLALEAILHPRAGYVPKVPRMDGCPVILQAYCPQPYESAEQERLHLLCPVLISEQLDHYSQDPSFDKLAKQELAATPDMTMEVMENMSESILNATLTPIIMKCFERLVMRQIKDLLPLDPMQFVYHPNRSTDDAISTILHLCLTHLENKDTYVRMLFTDFSSAFNTIIPQHLTEKLSLLVINTFLCNWILDFLTGRPQSLRIGNSASSATALNTEAPQGCMLSPLLFILLTHDYAAMHSSNHIIKFADDMTVVGLISKNNKSAYREEVQRLTVWCKANNLSLNVEKMKEMVVDFRTAQSDHFPLNIINSRERDQNLQNPAVGAQSMDPPLRFKDGDSSLLHSGQHSLKWRRTDPVPFFYGI
ncbi:hypothetical protein QTP86_008710 [Hemibagrus guttatus]|nr:hypothetical protein QTP86_008710 [Hemibagrus guttatus]